MRCWRTAQLTVLFVCIYGAVCIYQTGATPLYTASFNDNEAVVSALLAAGADKNLQTKVRFVAAAADSDNALNAVNSAALAAVICEAILCVGSKEHQTSVGISII